MTFEADKMAEGYALATMKLADWTSIETVYRVTPFLLLLGLLTAFLPRHVGRPTL